MLCLLALVVALVAWAVTSGGGKSGGGNHAGAPSGSHTPATSITPGPTPTGPHISGEPGGRDTAPSDSSGGSSSGGSGSGTTAGGGSDSGASGTPADGGADGGSNSGSGTAGSSGAAQEVPAGSTLPDCSPGSVTLALAGVRNSYGPGEDPEFRLTATNTGDTTCKMDFGPRSAVLTVTQAPGGDHVWASDDCPTTGSHLLQVPAHSATVYTVRWNARTSSPHCGSPKGKAAPAGTYLVQARMAGYGTKQTSFQITED